MDQWLLYFQDDELPRKFFKWIVVKIIYDKQKYCQSYERTILQQIRRMKSCLEEIVYDIDFVKTIETNNDDTLKIFAQKIKNGEEFNDNDYRFLQQKHKKMRKERRK